jgi:hypothetical protein
MWKLPLLVLLTAPLGWRAWSELAGPSSETPPLELPAREELSRKKTVLAKLQADLETHAIDDDLSTCLFRVCSEPPRAVKRSRLLEPLAAALAAHTEAAGEVRTFASVYTELESDPARPAEVRSADLKRWLEERRGTVKDKKDREKLLAGELEALRAAVRAALRGRDAGEMKQAKDDIETMRGRLEKHRILCEGFRVLANWAERRLAELRITGELLTAARDDAAIQKSGLRGETVFHVSRYARLLDSAAEEELRMLIRTEAGRFCAGYLPARMEGDAMVLYRGLEVPREQIWVLWKPGRLEVKRYGEETQLVKTEYDEFNPPNPSAVEHYFRKVKEGDDTFHDQLRPTPRNHAARHFNGNRKTLVWTENAVRALLNGCPVRWPHESAMPVPYRRAEHLLEAIGKQPALFVPEKS